MSTRFFSNAMKGKIFERNETNGRERRRNSKEEREEKIKRRKEEKNKEEIKKKFKRKRNVSLFKIYEGNN